ncbi:MAG: DUF255 domain-containing protein [Pseudomonadota bacterium]
MIRQPPGSARDPDLHGALALAFGEKPEGYTPRTHLMDGDGPRYVNRLIREASPYLEQHAHNPVDWWPWGDAALEEAARRDVPVFLSAGYATCHWCHVMEEESFDNEEVAALLNTHFVPVKLDRESRPDIDQLYILATMIQNRHAGWPNSVWLMPDGRPFHTGTYFPRPQFVQVLGAIAQGWAGKAREEFEGFATRLSDAIAGISAQPVPEADIADTPAAALAQLGQAFNAAHGGFSPGTQFPQEGNLAFLLDHWRRGGPEDALRIADKTLSEIAAGGIHDHVGGGFHRYTVDVNWRTPHFEKMLYNQALLTRNFAEIHQITGATSAARAVARCIDYVLRDMTAADGAFFSAEDADSLDGTGKLEEGAFYVWTPKAMAQAFPEDAEWAIATLGAREPATLEAGPVAHLKPGSDPDWARLDPLLDGLLDVRDGRSRPLRDEKVIGGWNGLMIRAMAEAGILFDRPDWTEAARTALDGVMARLGPVDALSRYHAGGAAREDANLSDHAWLGLAALALDDLALAEELAHAIVARFALPDGRMALMREGAPLGPVMETEDGAVPSGESSALELLVALSQRGGPAQLHPPMHALAAALSGRIAETPIARLEALTASRALADGAAGAVRFVGDGAVRVALRQTEAGALLAVRIAEGWHLAASAEQDLVPPELTGAETEWPEPVPWTDGSGHTSAVHKGRFDLVLRAPTAEVTLHLQACSESLCLTPETVRIRLS